MNDQQDGELTLRPQREGKFILLSKMHAACENINLLQHKIVMVAAWRQRGRVVRVLDFESVGPRFESHSEHFMDLFHGSPEL